MSLDCPTDLSTEVRHASYYRNAGSCLQDPGTRWIFRKEHRRCHSECRNPRIKDHSRDEMVRSRANARPYRKWVCSPLSGRLASWIYTREVMLGRSPSLLPAKSSRRLPFRRRRLPVRTMVIESNQVGVHKAPFYGTA